MREFLSQAIPYLICFALIFSTIEFSLRSCGFFATEWRLQPHQAVPIPEPTKAGSFAPVIASEGNTIIVGMPNSSGGPRKDQCVAGVAYIYRKTNQAWQLQQTFELLGFYAKKNTGEGFYIYGRDVDDSLSDVPTDSADPIFRLNRSRISNFSVFLGSNTYYLGAGSDNFKFATATADSIVHGEVPVEWITNKKWTPPSNTTFNDTITTGSGNDTIYGGLGNDTIRGGMGINSLYGGTGNDRLTGGQDTDLLDGYRSWNYTRANYSDAK